MPGIGGVAALLFQDVGQFGLPDQRLVDYPALLVGDAGGADVLPGFGEPSPAPADLDTTPAAAVAKPANTTALGSCPEPIMVNATMVVEMAPSWAGAEDDFAPPAQAGGA